MLCMCNHIIMIPRVGLPNLSKGCSEKEEKPKQKQKIDYFQPSVRNFRM
jgi:hypothetical protein